MDVYDKLRMAIYGSEFLATMVGFISWKKLRNSYWKWFPIYLLVITAIETVTESVFDISHNMSFNLNIHKYLGIPLQFLFFPWLFYQEAQGKKRIWPVAGMIIYLVAWAADLLFFQDRELWFLSFSYTIGNIVLLVLAIGFFLRLVNSDAIIHYRTRMMFWIVMGLLVFYLGSFPLYGMYNTLAIKYPDLFNNYWIISAIMDCVMYLLFAVSFIWGKPK